VKIASLQNFFLTDELRVRESAEQAQNPRISEVSRPSEDRQTSPTTSSEASTPLAIEALLWRMRSGDREAAAEFLMRYGSRVRRRIRGKLAPTLRRVFDSMDILSTLGRRLDLYVMSGRVQASNEAQLWSLLFKMADHALVDKARMIRTSQEIERENSVMASKHATDDKDAKFGIDHCLGLLSDPVDRTVLSLWLVGDSHVEIGRQLKLGADAVRKRFKRIQALLKERYQAGVA
jgi:DNA-directed RNA polymerase specialized sigma24 family protein